MSQLHDDIPESHLPPPQGPAGVTLLRPADADALDRVIDGSPAPAAGDASHAPAWLNLMRADPLEAPAADLVERTMQRLVESRQRQRFATQIATLARDLPPRTIGFEWRNLATAAAVILIGLSLVLPLLERTRAEARRVACAGNQAAAGMAMGHYAADHGGVMPRRLAQPGDEWWRVGAKVVEGQPVNSNTAHLYLLVRMRYVRPDTLACPDNTHAPRRPLHALVAADDWSSAQAVSYSYQNQFTAEPIRLDRAPQLAVLADKNPLFVIRVSGLDFDRSQTTTATSRFHNRVGPGQNVLTVAGHVSFAPTPLVPKPNDVLADNIWLVDSRPAGAGYSGNESPDAPTSDAFLVP